MIFNIEFDERALKEWNKLDSSVREQFKKKLKKLQTNPYIESARLNGEQSNCYKIKLRSSGYRLVYQIIDSEIVIFVIAIGKRDAQKAYKVANIRLTK
ncbi:type II toxin-antitoxin system RelE family toxin [Providencia heimbachae]|uniref:RelE family antibacterial toxin protein n=1 Tax=Providencia heimbachae ATCC 35613 TaxID=1354272 RepID=A0A1B7JVG2_9GAMM|nr:type II toxin-antitoxin system RelE/ParE family toxin [Providencia heimbachae]OAT51865.1 RelE family antibacterial toxin protein [Providencia heimbachae ATCC 35613]SQH15473.1 mRNA interferase RelE [Providencia heimbachae]